jgi:arginase
MAEAAHLPLPYPETAVIEEESLDEQNLALAIDLPERPLVLGGCCCAHVGAVEGLAARHGRIALVWFDAHGDLNTPETSPSGDLWGMPFRMLLDSGAVEPEDVALLGARNLDPPEREYLAATGIHTEPEALDGVLTDTEGTYVALDCDALDTSEVEAFMPEPGGLSLEETEELLAGIRERAAVLGVGLSGLTGGPSNVEPLTRLCAALGL